AHQCPAPAGGGRETQDSKTPSPQDARPPRAGAEIAESSWADGRPEPTRPPIPAPSFRYPAIQGSGHLRSAPLLSSPPMPRPLALLAPLLLLLGACAAPTGPRLDTGDALPEDLHLGVTVYPE